MEVLDGRRQKSAKKDGLQAFFMQKDRRCAA
jgi:hypothetical protein